MGFWDTYKIDTKATSPAGEPQGPCLDGPVYKPEELVSLEMSSEQENWVDAFERDLKTAIVREEKEGILPDRYQESESLELIRSLSYADRQQLVMHGLSLFRYRVPQSYDSLSPARKRIDKLLRYVFCPDELQGIGPCLMSYDFKNLAQYPDRIIDNRHGCGFTGEVDSTREYLMSALVAAKSEDLLVWTMGWIDSRPQPVSAETLVFQRQGKFGEKRFDKKMIAENLRLLGISVPAKTLFNQKTAGPFWEVFPEQYLKEAAPRTETEKQETLTHLLTELARHRFEIQLALSPAQQLSAEELDNLAAANFLSRPLEWGHLDGASMVTERFQWLSEKTKLSNTVFCNTENNFSICTWWKQQIPLLEGNRPRELFSKISDMMQLSGLFEMGRLPFTGVRLDDHGSMAWDWRYHAGVTCEVMEKTGENSYKVECPEGRPHAQAPALQERKDILIPASRFQKHWGIDFSVSLYHELMHGWWLNKLDFDFPVFLWKAIDGVEAQENRCVFPCVFEGTPTELTFFDLFNESAYLPPNDLGSLIGHGQSNYEELLASAQTTFTFAGDQLAYNIVHRAPLQHKVPALLVWAYVRDEAFGKVFTKNGEDPFENFQFQGLKTKLGLDGPFQE